MDEQVIDIPGLSGEEIIIDLCEQIAAKLRQDCNLRESDSYINGYTAEVSIKIKCFGIDTAEVTTVVSAKNAPAVKADGAESVTTVDQSLTVDHEPDLMAVRERSSLSTPSVENQDKEVPAKDEGSKRRRYSGAAPKASGGGAEDINLGD